MLTCLPHHLCQITSWPTETPFQYNPDHVLHWFSYFILSNLTTGYKYWIYQTICQAKPLKCIIKLYIDHKNLWVKHTTHQKAESLRGGSLSKLDNMVKATQSSIQSVLNFLQNGRSSLLFTNLLVHTINQIPIKNQFLHFS